MFCLSECVIAAVLKVLLHSRKGGGTFFYPTDFALVVVSTYNHQEAHVSSPDYSEHNRALSFSLSGTRQDTLFFSSLTQSGSTEHL